MGIIDNRQHKPQSIFLNLDEKDECPPNLCELIPPPEINQCLTTKHCFVEPMGWDI